MDALYIDSRMGITGIKLLGALVDTLENPELFVRRFNEMGFKGLRLEREAEALNGITGSRMQFIRTSDEPMYDDDEFDDDDGEKSGGFFSRSKNVQPSRSEGSRHGGRTLDNVTDIIEDLPLSGKVRKRAVNIYKTIAEAASKANRKPVDELILRRTGSRDIIASVVAICIIIDELEVERIIASPVATGTGYAMTYRGRMPIPIPALQNILGEIPYSSGTEEGEICSLEGGAILKEFADEFSDMPEMVVIRSGAGFGGKNFRSGVNCTRVFMGNVVRTAANASITELEASLYNDSAETLKLTGERLIEAGALEAFTVPVSLLSGGGGLMLKCICPNDAADDVASEILRNTSATSVRRMAVAAYELEVTLDRAATSIGEISILKSTGFGVTKTRPLAADIERAARENNMSISQAYAVITKEI